MKIIRLSEIPTMVSSISSVRILKRRPSYKRLEVKRRDANGFFLLEEGECVYSWSGGQARLQPGSLLYLPWDSAHKMEVLSQEFSFSIIHFTLRDRDGETVIFSKTPLLVAKSIGNYFIDYIQRMADEYLESADNFKNIAIVSMFLSELCSQKNAVNKKVAPAISYINNNLLNPVDGDTLASLCSLSKAQMYRLFKQETGMTPTEYRNKIRVEKACQLLSTKEYYIYEVATELGFENIGYFNRVFKEYMGVPPKDYLA